MGKAVMDDAAEDDPGIQKSRKKFVKLIQDLFFKFVNSLEQSKSALNNK